MESYEYGYIGAGISLISSLVIILIYILNKKIQNLEGIKLVIILVIFDFCSNLVIFIPTPLISSDILCSIQGVLLQYFSICEMLWTGFISAQLYWGVKNGNNCYFSLFKGILYVSVLSIITAVIPLGLSSYSYAGSWCFFDQSYKGNRYRDILFRFLLFYLMLWGTLIWNMILYIKSIIIIRQNSRENINNIISMVKYYPFALIICYLPLTILTILQALSDNDPKNYLNFSFFLSRLIGFVNAIIYGFTNKIWKSLYRKSSRIANESIQKLINNTVC